MRSLGKLRRRWEDNLRMHLKQVGKNVDRINLAHDRDQWLDLVNMVMNPRVP